MSKMNQPFYFHFIFPFNFLPFETGLIFQSVRPVSLRNTTPASIDDLFGNMSVFVPFCTE